MRVIQMRSATGGGRSAARSAQQYDIRRDRGTTARPRDRRATGRDGVPSGVWGSGRPSDTRGRGSGRRRASAMNGWRIGASEKCGTRGRKSCAIAACRDVALNSVSPRAAIAPEIPVARSAQTARIAGQPRAPRRTSPRSGDEGPVRAPIGRAHKASGEDEGRQEEERVDEVPAHPVAARESTCRPRPSQRARDRRRSRPRSGSGTWRRPPRSARGAGDRGAARPVEQDGHEEEGDPAGGAVRELDERLHGGGARDHRRRCRWASGCRSPRRSRWPGRRRPRG